MKIKIQILILIIFTGIACILPVFRLSRHYTETARTGDIETGYSNRKRALIIKRLFISRHPSPAPHTDTYDYDSEILHRRNLINRKIIEEATAHIKERENAMKLARQLLDHGFPSWAREKGTACFYSAFDELCGMLHDSLPMNLGRAIFITENAFLENTMNYNAFEASLQKTNRFVQLETQ